MLTEACRGKQLSGFLASPSLCIIGPFFNDYFSTVVWNLFSHDCIYLTQRQLSWSHLKSQSGLCCRSFPSTPTQSKAETLDSSESFCKPVSDRTEQWLLSAYKNALLMSEIRHLEGCAAVVDPSKCCLFSAVCHHNIKLLKSGLSAPRRGADNERLCAVLIWWHFRGRGFHSHRHTLMATLQSHPQTVSGREKCCDTGCEHLCARLSWWWSVVLIRLCCFTNREQRGRHQHAEGQRAEEHEAG